MTPYCRIGSGWARRGACVDCDPTAHKKSPSHGERWAFIRDSAANLGINCFIQNTKKLKQPSLMLLNTRYEALAAKFECVDTFEF